MRGEPTKGGDQSLFDRQRRELAQLLQERGPLRHDLTDQCERAIGLFAHERPQVCGAEEQRLRLLVGARVGRVLAVRRQSFGAKRFTGCRHPRNEAPSRTHAASQHHASPHDDEHPVCVRAPLVDLKTSGPRGSCRVALQCDSLGLGQARDGQACVLVSDHHASLPFRSGLRRDAIGRPENWRELNRWRFRSVLRVDPAGSMCTRSGCGKCRTRLRERTGCGLESLREIGELALREPIVIIADRFVHGRERHVRVAVVLVGDVDEVAVPGPRAQPQRSA